MRSFISLIFILNLLKVGAQSLDSLSKLAANLNSDSARVNLFYAAGYQHRNSNPVFSLECAKKAEAFAEKSKLPYYMAKAGNLLGILHYRQNNLGQALHYHKRSLQLQTEIKDLAGQANSYTNLGNLFSELKRFGLAEDSYIHALQINTELGAMKQVGNCLLNLGVLLIESRSFGNEDFLIPEKRTTMQAAKLYFVKALQNARERFDYELEALCLNNLSHINILLGRYNEALANAFNSIKIKNLTENEVEKADSYLNLSRAYFRKRESRAALHYLGKADEIIKKFNYSAARLESLKIRSDYYKQEGNFELAFRSLSAMLQLKDSLEVDERLAEAENDMNASKLHAGFSQKPFQFPYLYMNILIVVALSIIMSFINFRK